MSKPCGRQEFEQDAIEALSLWGHKSLKGDTQSVAPEGRLLDNSAHLGHNKQ